MDEFDKNLLVAILQMLMGFACIIALLALIVNNLSSISCDKQYNDFQHRYSFMEGCMIKPDTQWIPVENYVTGKVVK